jgi:membrane protease YdiL (CAAX protease family)
MPEFSESAERLIGGIVPVAVVGCLVIWAAVGARLVRGQPVVAYEPRRQVPWNFFHFLLVSLVLFGPLLIHNFGGAPAISPDEAEIPRSPDDVRFLMIASIATQIASFFVVVMILRCRTKPIAADFGWDVSKAARDLALGLGAFVALLVPVYAIQAALVEWVEVPYEHGLIDALKVDNSLVNFAICTLTAVIIAPLTEEFLFRLALQGWFERAEAVLLGDRLSDRQEETKVGVEDVSDQQISDFETPLAPENPYLSSDLVTSPPEAEPSPQPRRAPRWPRGLVPVLLSSSLFALAHLGQGAAPIPLFFLGIGLGYLYRRTHRLLPCILVHMLVNATSMAMMGLALFG